jgi:hypothetical protein
MVKSFIYACMGLVGLYFVLMNPAKVVELLQLIIDGAHNLAKQLGSLNVHEKPASK